MKYRALSDLRRNRAMRAGRYQPASTRRHLDENRASAHGRTEMMSGGEYREISAAAKMSPDGEAVGDRIYQAAIGRAEIAF